MKFYTKEEFAKAGKNSGRWYIAELDDLISITELVLEYVQNLEGFELASTPIRIMLENYREAKQQYWRREG